MAEEGAVIKQEPSVQYSCAIIYGNIAWYLGTKATQFKTHKWCLYIRGPQNEDLSFIKSVEFHLHESFAEPVRVISAAPFEVHETGWGEFEARIVVNFVDPLEEPVSLMHQIHLHAPDGKNPSPRVPVVAETMDEVIFVDPSPLMVSALQKSGLKPLSAPAQSAPAQSADFSLTSHSNANDFSSVVVAPHPMLTNVTSVVNAGSLKVNLTLPTTSTAPEMTVRSSSSSAAAMTVPAVEQPDEAEMKLLREAQDTLKLRIRDLKSRLDECCRLSEQARHTMQDVLRSRGYLWSDTPVTLWRPEDFRHVPMMEEFQTGPITGVTGTTTASSSSSGNLSKKRAKFKSSEQNATGETPAQKPGRKKKK